MADPPATPGMRAAKTRRPDAAPPRAERPRPGEETRAALRSVRPLVIFAALFSAFANLLMLTGPLYMLQVYDRVLGSRSEATLLALTALVIFLYAIMGLLDFVRGRIMSRVGARLQDRLDRRVFDAVMTGAARRPGAALPGGPDDLEAVQRALGAPVTAALFDLPWTPIFLAGIFLFHPALGVLACAGGAVLVVLALVNQWATRRALAEGQQLGTAAGAMAGRLRAEADTLRSLGMTATAHDRWQEVRRRAAALQQAGAERAAGFASTTKSARLLLQSLMLGLGAYLVLRGQLTPGAMIAGSILLGRALAPVEMLLNQWPMLARARRGWTALGALLQAVPPEPERLALPRPAAKLEVRQLTLVPPGETQAALRMVSFELAPGQALGVIGPSGAGKSSLARALVGLWAPAGGRVRLDGASLDSYAPEVLGRLVGYVPQRVALFDGTIAQNIARLDADPDPEAVVAAARAAAAHDLILRLPQGYDTPISAAAPRLSGGQIQRIALARALYGDPVLVVLDEPNSNLDAEGSEAVNQAIRALKARGAAVLIMAHRPAAIHECDLLMVLDGGQRAAFGPRDEVLRQTIQNHREIARGASSGAGSLR